MEKRTKPIELSKVASVYVGESGKCCCGCSGEHHYQSSTVDQVDRGYPIDKDEIDDAFVAFVVDRINQAVEDGIAMDEGFDENGHVFFDLDGVLTIAYAVEKRDYHFGPDPLGATNQ